MTEPASVAFEVLFKTAGSGTLPTAATRENFRPPPDAVRSALGWLQTQGVSCHSTGFSLACSVPAERFTALFGKLRAPRVPVELTAWVEAISVPPAVELF